MRSQCLLWCRVVTFFELLLLFRRLVLILEIISHDRLDYCLGFLLSHRLTIIGNFLDGLFGLVWCDFDIEILSATMAYWDDLFFYQIVVLLQFFAASDRALLNISMDSHIILLRYVFRPVLTFWTFPRLILLLRLVPSVNTALTHGSHISGLLRKLLICGQLLRGQLMGCFIAAPQLIILILHVLVALRQINVSLRIRVGRPGKW